MPEIFTPSEDKPIVQVQKASPPSTPPPGVSSQKHPHPFTAFCDHPDGVWFQQMDEGENINLVLRKHPITNVPWMFLSLALMIIPPTIALLITGNPNIFGISLTFVPQSYVLVLLYFYYLIVLGYMIVNFITWFFNVSLITEKRVIDIDFSDVVYRNVAETTVDRLKDVEFTQSGVIRSFFDYGDVMARTEGIEQNFDFNAVPHPSRIVKIIGNMMEKIHGS